MPIRGWTEEQKQRQRELIKRWKPWEKSTGAKTKTGKAIVSQNALKTGEHHRILRDLNHQITQIRREQKHLLDVKTVLELRK